MKLAIFLTMIWVFTGVSSFAEQGIKITKISSDQQIQNASRLVLQKYGVRAEIKVNKRNSQGK